MDHPMYIEPYLLTCIVEGRKTMEARPAVLPFLLIQPGDIIVFNDAVRTLVTRVADFTHLTKAVTEADIPHLWPGLRREQVLAALQRWHEHKARYRLFTFRLA